MDLYIETITIDERTLVVERKFMEHEDQSSGWGLSEWYPNNTDHNDLYYSCNLLFNDTVRDFCQMGIVANFSNMPNLAELYLGQPDIHDSMRTEKIKQLKSYWSLAAKMVVQFPMHKTVPLKTLVLGSEEYAAIIPGDVTLVDAMSIAMKRLLALDKITLNLVMGDDKPVGILRRLLAPQFSISDIGIGYGNVPFSEDAAAKSYSIFKGTAQGNLFKNIRHPTLTQLRTRTKYLRMVLRSCRGTLEALKMDAVTVHSDMGFETFETAIAILHQEMDLEELVIKRTNAGGCGVFFDRVNRNRNNPKVTGTNRQMEIRFMPEDADN